VGPALPGQDNRGAFAAKEAVSPDGATVYAAATSGQVVSDDYATIAYNASTGARRWLRLYNGTGLATCSGSTVSVGDGAAVPRPGWEAVATVPAGRSGICVMAVSILSQMPILSGRARFLDNMTADSVNWPVRQMAINWIIDYFPARQTQRARRPV
jgi:hypothetical protein